jgi:broad specificity phosphatase PhoE
MTIFHLVRHASHDLIGIALTGRTTDIGLSEQGRAEALRLAERFAPMPIAAVYASALRRAAETAETIANRIQLNVLLDARLIELDFGGWSGLTFDLLQDDPEWRRWNDFRSGTRAPGGETIAEAQARIIAAMIDLRDRHGDCEIVLVSHGDVIKAALAYWAGISLDHLRRIEIAPASISRVSLTAHGVSILEINERVAASPHS